MYCLRHLAYENSRAQLRRALDDHRPGHMVFLIGPSGAGKTTMRTSVMQEMFGDPAHWGRGKIPAIEQFAFLVNQSYFSSKDFVRELLSELHDPSLEWLLRDSSIPAAKLSQIQSQLKITHEASWLGDASTSQSIRLPLFLRTTETLRQQITPCT